MNIEGRITILFNEDGMDIELSDVASSIRFADIHLNPKQTCQALSRLGETPCEKMEVYGLDVIGKKQEHKSFEFEVPYEYTTYSKREEVKRIAKLKCPKGWIPDMYFNSQNSFFKKNNKYYARTVMRRWV